MSRIIQRAAVVGGGYMGGGIAATIAGAGIPCVLYDVDEATAARRVQELNVESASWAAEGLIDQLDAATTVRNLSPGRDIRAEGGSYEFVIEAVPEDVSIKEAALRTISGSVSDSCVIASNTSTLQISRLAAFVALPSRFLGCHWMNPARLVPGVEIIPHSSTDRSAVDSALELHFAIGKRPTPVADVPGFVANRLQHALYAEALKLVDEGVATAEVVDEVTRNSFGSRLAAFGPFEVGDMAGLDVYKACLDSEREAYGDRFATTDLLENAVAEGRIGLKSGRGLTAIAEKDPAKVSAIRNRYFRGLAQLLDSIDGLEQLRGRGAASRSVTHDGD